MIFKSRRSGVRPLALAFCVYGIGQLFLMTIQFRYENLRDQSSSDMEEVDSSQPITTVISNLTKTPSTTFTSTHQTSPLLRKYGGFMRVDNITVEAQTFAFSAYFYNEGRGNVVRVLVLAMQKNSLDPTLCQFYGSTNKKLPSSLSNTESNVIYEGATRQDIREHHNRKYAAAVFTCNVPYNMKPAGVSLTTKRCENPSNFLPIQYPENQKWQFTVCVTPLNFRYSKAYELVEMIEMNRILGADHFVFYNHSTHVNVDKVLKYYIAMGLVEVVQWHLPMRVDVWPKVKGHTTEIHYFGQLGALNDCLYRNRYKSKYLVYQDLDEFIFPYKHQNWSAMIGSLQERGVYMFRNTFFRKDWNDTDEPFDGKNLARKFKSTILLKTMREAKIFGLRQRSKYIINPRKVDIVGIHNIWKERAGSSILNVSPDVALIHHYRDWENPRDKIRREDDQRALQFKDKLLGRMKTAWAILKDVELGPLGY